MVRMRESWMSRVLGAVASCVITVAIGCPTTEASAQSAVPVCSREWSPLQGRRVNVRSVYQLERAIAEAKPGDTLLLANGDYALRRTLEISTPNLIVRSASGNRDAVVLHGQGMKHDMVKVAIAVSASDVTIADLSVRDVEYHAVQVRGERNVQRFTLFNARLRDTGQQLLKVSTARGRYADAGIVACSDFSYTESAPSDYTNGVDLLAGKDWIIRDNRFSRIRGPASGGYRAGPTILVWLAAVNTIVERNVIVDSFRGIALGLVPEARDLRRGGELAFDHVGGIIRGNVVVNLNRWSDEAIEANAAKEVRIEHNTVLVLGQADWSISARFDTASATVVNNLTNRRILRRNGGHVDERGNVVTATPEWFVDPGAANLRLSALGRTAAGAAGAFPPASDAAVVPQ